MSAGLLVLALSLHLLVLVLPLALIGLERVSALQVEVVALWLLAALGLHAAERWASATSEEPWEAADADSRLALATGLVLLFSQWSALLEHGCGSLLDPRLAPVGGVLAAFGIALRAASMRALGPDFVSAPWGRGEGELTQTGLYALARHPSELGLLSFALGSALLLSSAASLGVVVVVLVPLTRWRLLREDRALLARFPGYADYAQLTGWFAPRLRARP